MIVTLQGKIILRANKIQPLIRYLNDHSYSVRMFDVESNEIVLNEKSNTSNNILLSRIEIINEPSLMSYSVYYSLDQMQGITLFFDLNE